MSKSGVQLNFDANKKAQEPISHILDMWWGPQKSAE